MSLIDEMMSDCVFMNKAKVSDGEGGFVTTWTEGASIKIAITIKDDNMLSIADKPTLVRTYTLTTSKSNELEKYDVIKRLSDNAIFRVTSNSEDRLTPKSSPLDIAQVTAERWELTT